MLSLSLLHALWTQLWSFSNKSLTKSSTLLDPPPSHNSTVQWYTHTHTHNAQPATYRHTYIHTYIHYTLHSIVTTAHPVNGISALAPTAWSVAKTKHPSPNHIPVGLAANLKWPDEQWPAKGITHVHTHHSNPLISPNCTSSTLRRRLDVFFGWPERNGSHGYFFQAGWQRLVLFWGEGREGREEGRETRSYVGEGQRFEEGSRGKDGSAQYGVHSEQTADKRLFAHWYVVGTLDVHCMYIRYIYNWLVWPCVFACTYACVCVYVCERPALNSTLLLMILYSRAQNPIIAN